MQKRTKEGEQNEVSVLRGGGGGGEGGLTDIMNVLRLWY